MVVGYVSFSFLFWLPCIFFVLSSFIVYVYVYVYGPSWFEFSKISGWMDGKNVSACNKYCVNMSVQRKSERFVLAETKVSKLYQNCFETVSKQFRNGFKTVSFQFHFIVQTFLRTVPWLCGVHEGRWFRRKLAPTAWSRRRTGFGCCRRSPFQSSTGARAPCPNSPCSRSDTLRAREWKTSLYTHTHTHAPVL